MKSLLFTVCLSLAATLAPITWAAKVETPVEMVRREVAAVLAALDDGNLSAATRRQVISDRIAQHFDFDDMSHRILAMNWKQADEVQRDRFKALFRQTLEGKYVSAIEKRTSEVVKVGGERIRGDLASVIVTIERTQIADIPLLFKLKKKDTGWMVYDANVEGLSLIQHYREEYGGIVSTQGVDGLLTYMQQRLES